MVVLDTESVNLDDGERLVWQFSVFFVAQQNSPASVYG
jgi:hypothetical protein